MMTPQPYPAAATFLPQGKSMKLRHEIGFSLIEVLVTILILTFGLLGIAGLLVSGVSNAASTEARSKASLLAAEIADRMRANSAQALSASSNYVFSYGATIPSQSDIDGAATDGAKAALADKKAWLTAIRAQLPSGDGSISSTVTGGARTINIQVRWSNCLGTLDQSNQENCTQGASAGRYQNIAFELRL